MNNFEEPIDDRFKIRFTLGKGSQSSLSHGYSIKFILIDESNLLLYQNILELSYSTVKRAVKGSSSGETIVRGKKTQPAKPSWNERTTQLLTKNFVDESCRIIGEENRGNLRRALKLLMLKVNKMFPPENA